MSGIVLVAGDDGRGTGDARRGFGKTRGDGETAGRTMVAFINVVILAWLSQPRLNAAHSAGCRLSSSKDAVYTFAAVSKFSI